MVNNNPTNSSSVNRSFSNGENLFSSNHQVDKSVFASIDGATALRLDDSYEIKGNEEQNNLINNFERDEEKKILENGSLQKNHNDEIPSGVSIESASYMEQTDDVGINETVSESNNLSMEEIDKEYTPKLFSEENVDDNSKQNVRSETQSAEELFDSDTSEDEDFEIPAFLRRQKF